MEGSRRLRADSGPGLDGDGPHAGDEGARPVPGHEVGSALGRGARLAGPSGETHARRDHGARNVDAEVDGGAPAAPVADQTRGAAVPAVGGGREPEEIGASRAPRKQGRFFKRTVEAALFVDHLWSAV